MTSFNHYALGSVAQFLHGVVAGISPLDAGWKKIKVHPQPGGNLKSASASHITPYGKVAIQWELGSNGKIKAEVEVPPNTTAEVHIGDQVKELGSGLYSF